MRSDEVRWLDELELDAWVNLIRLASRIVAMTDAELRRTSDITGRDYEVLHHLSTSSSGRRLTELADLIDDSSSCITHRVNRLVAAGLVDKRADPSDGRARRVALTRAGRALVERTAPGHAQRVRRWIIDPLDRTDLADLARVASTLNEHLRDVEER
jgi:DNA-binding MarR family transcriptional regulator